MNLFLYVISKLERKRTHLPRCFVQLSYRAQFSADFLRLNQTSHVVHPPRNLRQGGHNYVFDIALGLRKASMALSIPANLNLLGYELAEKFAASAEYCEPLEVKNVSLGLKLRRPLTLSLFSYGLTALAILAIPSPRPSTISSGERRTSVLFGLPVYPLSCVSCCCPERSFFSLISSGCFICSICRLLGAGFCLRDGNVKHLIRVLSEPNHGLEKHHATLVSSSDSLLQDLEMGTLFGGFQSGHSDFNTLQHISVKGISRTSRI